MNPIIGVSAAAGGLAVVMALLSIFAIAAVVLVSMGAITLNPDRSLLRLTTDNTDPNNGQQLQAAIANADFTNPGPMSVHTVQNNAAGQVIVVPATSALKAYWGFCPQTKGGKAGGVVAAYKGVTVEGFVGCTPGADVYLDATSAEASADASGLTHTVGTNTYRVGVALSATRIRFD